MSQDHLSNASNRLAQEKSPYLLQHAANPVDWYPWGDAAFAKATAEDKPVFLSIGYSSCHWCHVMERESFEDAATAAYLNAHFVSIKVDREERADVDAVYMEVCQLLTGGGGWPLSVFLTPQRQPFYAGTYWPPQAMRGQPAFTDILRGIVDIWQTQRIQVQATADQIIERLTPANDPSGPNMPPDAQDASQRCFQALAQAFEPRWGGFSLRPKFPSVQNLLFLLAYHQQYHESQALSMVEKTLDGMLRGGLHDHVGGGFCRYSTDSRWLAPHFEKMLYDNALLIMAYLQGGERLPKPAYRRAAQGAADYILCEMTDAQGGFYTAQDADSEGEEGKYYLWTPPQVQAYLQPALAADFCAAYDITAQGNFEGRSIPNLIGQDDAALEQTQQRLEPALDALRQARSLRVAPFCDTKVLTGLNGLMIAALAQAAQLLKEPRYLQAALNAEHFIRIHLRDAQGRLLARWRQGEARFDGLLEDYAYLLWGLLELQQAQPDNKRLEWMMQLADRLLAAFQHPQGGFLQSPADGERLIFPIWHIHDSAIPSGNAVAIHSLLRLQTLTGQASYRNAAQRALAAFGEEIKNAPLAAPYAQVALMHFVAHEQM